ncbi:hypothetical protein HanRHA438_Chr11g0491061 [Helianthus annuus]|nr:hypothetical protein HanRHA438_Chr11g0491061 [Helianthus annuus]
MNRSCWVVNIQTNSNGMLKVLRRFTAAVRLGGCGSGCSCTNTLMVVRHGKKKGTKVD